jgi:uncharacterized protein DUF992
MFIRVRDVTFGIRRRSLKNNGGCHAVVDNCRAAFLYGRHVPGSTLPIEIGVLTCTLGHAIAIDTRTSDPSSVASEAREMLCSFKPGKNGAEETYVGALKGINAGGTLPDKVALLWMVRAPTGTRPAPGLLQQTYAADSATPAGQTAPLVGERNTEITLHTMAEKEEGSTSKEKPVKPRFAITLTQMIAELYERQPIEKTVPAEKAIAGSGKVGHEAGPDRKPQATAVWPDRDLDRMKIDRSGLCGDNTADVVLFARRDVDVEHVCDLAREHAEIRTAVDKAMIADRGGMHRRRIVQRDRDDGTLDVTVQAWIGRVLKSHTL